MRRTAFVFFIFTLLVISQQCFGQNNGIAIGAMNNGVFEFNEQQRNLVKAFEWTFRDGTKVTELRIEQMGNGYFLLATCNYQGRKRIAAVDLDLEGIQFILREESLFKMCSAVACENCRFFFENNRIVACKCDETGTISNHCHYRSSVGTGYYANFQRAIRMSND